MKKKRFFEEMLDEIFDVTEKMMKAGRSYEECRLIQIIAVRLLFIEENTRKIMFAASMVQGMALGTIVSIIITIVACIFSGYA